MTIGVHPDIVKALGAIRGDVEHHLASVSRYRAMRSIEETMAEIAEFQDLVTPLRDVRERIEHQLNEIREYRALCTLDTIVPQLVDVLAFLDEKSNGEAPRDDGRAPVTTEPPADTQAEAQTLGVQIPDVYARAETAAAQGDVDGNSADVIDGADATTELRDGLASPENGSVEYPIRHPDRVAGLPDILSAIEQGDAPDEAAFVSSVPSSNPVSVDSGTPPSNSAADESSSDETPAPQVATLAYNLANMLVQSLPPNTSDGRSPVVDSPAGLAATTNADQTAQEGKAA